jgi:hypothetical protein
LSFTVYLALNEKDVRYALLHVKKQDFILTDVFCPKHLGQTLVATFFDKDDKKLVSSFSQWLRDVAGDNSNIYGYANNLYQSSIRPLAGYLSAIDNILANKGNNDIKFHFPVSLLWGKKSSTYYLAEYESAGIHLYDRHSVLLPYMEEYVLTKGIAIINGKKKFPMQVGIFNPLRLWGVFFSKLLLDLKSFKKNKFFPPIGLSNLESQVFIIRTVSQAITILPYLKMTRHKIIVIIGMTYTDTGAFDLLVSNTKDFNNICIHRARQANFYQTLNKYYQGFCNILQQRKVNFLYKGLSINLTQALKEVLVMMPNLALYNDQIKVPLSQVNAKRLFTLEQKSPHAFIDASLAKIQKIPSAQIQCVQQSFFNIPNPVVANFYFCETPAIKRSFQKAWPQYRDQVKYIGTFQGIENPIKKRATKDINRIIKVCFFAGVEQELNNKLFKFLSDFSDMNPIRFIVKLHPRDPEKYSKIFPKIDFLNTYIGTFSEFAASFDLAVTLPSGVISDLLFTATPFLVYMPDHNSYIQMEGSFLPEGMKPIKEISLLLNMLLEIDAVRECHKIILKNFKENQGLITDISMIEKNILNLLNDTAVKK